MIVGVGIDVVDVDRFAASIARTPALKAKLFTVGERDRGTASLAARFAAKEALAKALGAPRGLRWHDAEIISHDDGRPELRVTGTVAAMAESLGIKSFHVSLSHDAGIASAVVIAES
jgi:holo-[acyl-carrier protein] synthase